MAEPPGTRLDRGDASEPTPTPLARAPPVTVIVSTLRGRLMVRLTEPLSGASSLAARACGPGELAAAGGPGELVGVAQRRVGGADLDAVDAGAGDLRGPGTGRRGDGGGGEREAREQRGRGVTGSHALTLTSSSRPRGSPGRRRSAPRSSAGSPGSRRTGRSAPSSQRASRAASPRHLEPGDARRPRPFAPGSGMCRARWTKNGRHGSAIASATPASVPVKPGAGDRRDGHAEAPRRRPTRRRPPRRSRAAPPPRSRSAAAARRPSGEPAASSASATASSSR